MPTLNIDISKAKQFSNLPDDEYEGEIEGIFLQPPREKGKFGKLRVQYLVTDGDHLGRKSSEFLPLDPELTGFLVAWMRKFGGEWEEIDPAELKALAWETDENDELIDPDLAGTRVTFKVFTNKKGYSNTELVEVLDDVDVEAPLADDEPAADEDDQPADPDPEPPARAARPPARTAKPARVAAAAAPKRRTLR